MIRTRLLQLWRTVLWDRLDLTEILSGLTLVALRGAVLKWGPVISMSSDVADLLRQIGVTESRWGMYLLVCGVLQIWFSGQRTSPWRLVVTIAILAGFVLMTAAFLVNGRGNSGLICLSAFFTLLLYRVFRDRDSATAGVGPGGG